MNVDHILGTFNDCEVRYLLVGGMNFLLRHEPVLTFDVDLWVESSPGNLRRTERALSALEAQWGETDESWADVGSRASGWLGRQPMYCLTSPHGAIDIFLSVLGLDDWGACEARAVQEHTASAVPYLGLSDEDMLACQEALDAGERREDRMRVLKAAVEAKRNGT